jgi:drug/metabolite transporter (DMT)-like permease
MTTRNWLTLGFLSLIWGSSFLFIEVALTELPPFTIVALRVAIAAVALFGVSTMLGIEWPRKAVQWRDLAIMGLINNAIPFSLVVFAQKEITSSLASILNATTPIFAVLLAHFFTANEKITGTRAVGIAAGFVGAVIMLGGNGALAGSAAAQVAALAAALCYAISTIFGRRLKGINPIVISAVSLSSAAVVIVPLSLTLETPWVLEMPSLKVSATVLTFALLSTAGAYIIFFRLLGQIGATNVSLVTLLVPVGAILQGAFFLGESLSWREIEGMAFVALGLIAIDGRVWRKIARWLETPKPSRGSA